jgi:hypothetical protein
MFFLVEKTIRASQTLFLEVEIIFCESEKGFSIIEKTSNVV